LQKSSFAATKQAILESPNDKPPHILLKIMPTSKSPKNQSSAGFVQKIATWFYWLLNFLLAAAFALALAKLFLPMNSGWSEALLVLTATAGTLAALARQLPLQNVLLVAFIIVIFNGAALAVGALTGIPFGPFTFGEKAGPELFKTLPWIMPLFWLVVILNSRGTARLILRPWRKTKSYGFWVMGLAAILTALFDFALEPFASRVQHYWIWVPTQFPVAWYGAPLVDFPAWALVTLLALAFATPALINKQPRKKGSRTFHSLAVWLGGILFFAIACVAHGLWPAVAADAAIGIITAVFAVRGARW
jgi:putative membrane protein